MMIEVFNYIASFKISWHRLLCHSLLLQQFYSAIVTVTFSRTGEGPVPFTLHHSPLTIDHSHL